MSDYTKSTNFATKDNLSSGNPLKIVKGTEIDTEFNNIQTAIATKADLVSPTFTGTVVIPTATVTTATVTTATITTANISGGTIAGITDLAVADGGTSASTAAGARTNLGLAIGTDVQAWDADLDTWATKTAPSGTVVGTSDTQTLTNKTLGSGTVMNASVLTVGTSVATTSGTVVDFTNLPSFIKRITIMLNGVSTNGGSGVIVQLGTGATPTYKTTGYVSGNNFATTTNGLWIHAGINQADTRLGSCVITSFGGNIWNASAAGAFGNGAGSSTAGGYVSLGATLTALRITSDNGTDAFDAGSINIMYE